MEGASVDCLPVIDDETGAVWWEPVYVLAVVMPRKETRASLDDEDTASGKLVTLGEIVRGFFYVLDATRWDGVGVWRRVTLTKEAQSWQTMKAT